jgi:phosphatidylserine/phosphatidylglycerophosphate/cardiolipin synthase-like enzyme
MPTVVLAFCVVAFALWSPAESPVRISGVAFDGYLAGNPEPDSAIRLTNTDHRHPASIGGFVLTERFSPRKKRAALTTTSSESGLSVLGSSRTQTRGDDDDDGIRFPQGAVIPAGGELWVASTAKGFITVWGEAPAFETAGSLSAVADVEGAGTFLKLPSSRGTVALVDDGGGVIDFVPYDNTTEPIWSEDDFSALPWRGGPVLLKNTSFYGWKGQVLARDRDESGRLLPDTDRAEDWDSGFSSKALGEEPTHRIERMGQSRFVSTPLKVRAKVTATSAPDNNHKTLVAALSRAKKSIRVRIYEFTNPKIAEALLKARARGVQVTIYVEGAPVGGISDQERWILDRCDKAGIRVLFLGGTPKNPVKPRYRFDHSKYVIIDDELAIIGTENYGRTGVPIINSYGNRGWMVHIENRAFVAQLRAVWDADLRLDKKDSSPFGDIVDIRADAEDAYGMPYRDPTFVPDDTVHRGRYEKPVEPVVVEDEMELELVLSPDTSLNEHSAVLGIIERAQKTLFIEQNSIRRRWGKLTDDNETEGDVPNLALQAVVAAARRGVKVRVLLDSTWYNVQGDEDRDNDDVALWLNALAAREGLDIVAKVINLETTGLQKIHAKGVIGDDSEVFVGSINWTENSFKGNREVGVVVKHPRVAGYYADLFRRDWARSRVFDAPIRVSQATAHTSPDSRADIVMRLGAGDTVFVVGEHIRGAARWLEIRLPGTDRTAFLAEKSIGPPKGTPGEALHLIDKDAVIEGVVVATHVTDRRIQLRFADEKRPPFTVIIFARDIPAFKDAGLDPAQAFQGRLVRVSGKVTQYRGPEVVASRPAQLTIVR